MSFSVSHDPHHCYSKDIEEKRKSKSYNNLPFLLLTPHTNFNPETNRTRILLINACHEKGEENINIINGAPILPVQ
jgi:hypothetical protein